MKFSRVVLVLVLVLVAVAMVSGRRGKNKNKADRMADRIAAKKAERKAKMMMKKSMSKIRLAPVLKTIFPECVISYTCSYSYSDGSVLKQSHQSKISYKYMI